VINHLGFVARGPALTRTDDGVSRDFATVMREHGISQRVDGVLSLLGIRGHIYIFETVPRTHGVEIEFLDFRILAEHGPKIQFPGSLSGAIGWWQQNVGQRLQNDDATLQRYIGLARKGLLRCHMLYINGEPCAFTRGEISSRAYHYETPGFLTEYRHYSPGVVLLMWTIKDLIENSPCTLFDFGAGGDEHGYKARFGTLAVHCKDLQLAPIWRPYSAALLAMHFALSAAKNAASKAIVSGVLRQRLKKAIRQEAAGSRAIPAAVSSQPRT